VINLLDLGLIHGRYLTPLDTADTPDDTDRLGADRHGESRTATCCR
jgi:hypothetical protein